LIDEQIYVLRMDYKETAEVRKIKADGEKVAAGDGT
jgi:hypothetical protein